MHGTIMAIFVLTALLAVWVRPERHARRLPAAKHSGELHRRL